MIACFSQGDYCGDPSVLLQHHGDYQCMPEAGGVECFGQDYGDSIKYITELLSLASQHNNIRPGDSGPLPPRHTLRAQDPTWGTHIYRLLSPGRRRCKPYLVDLAQCKLQLHETSRSPNCIT
eukprot:2328884-Prymnesium_polylepis.2